jgi:hypothetical protein
LVVNSSAGLAAKAEIANVHDKVLQSTSVEIFIRVIIDGGGFGAQRRLSLPRMNVSVAATKALWQAEARSTELARYI